MFHFPLRIIFLYYHFLTILSCFCFSFLTKRLIDFTTREFYPRPYLHHVHATFLWISIYWNYRNTYLIHVFCFDYFHNKVTSLLYLFICIISITARFITSAIWFSALLVLCWHRTKIQPRLTNTKISKTHEYRLLAIAIIIKS